MYGLIHSPFVNQFHERAINSVKLTSSSNLPIGKFESHNSTRKNGSLRHISSDGCSSFTFVEIDSKHKRNLSCWKDIMTNFLLKLYWNLTANCFGISHCFNWSKKSSTIIVHSSNCNGNRQISSCAFKSIWNSNIICSAFRIKGTFSSRSGGNTVTCTNVNNFSFKKL